MKTVPLQDLPLWSKWPERLLTRSGGTDQVRTVARIESEYNQDKYAKCLAEFHRLNGSATPESIKAFEFGRPDDHQLCVSIEDELYAMPLREARDAHYQMLLTTLGPQATNVRTLVELGAGYGFNCWMLKKHFPQLSIQGGEYSQNAVQLGGLLYERMPVAHRVRLRQFNFYDPASYTFLNDLAGPIAVYTVHAVEQCPSAAVVIENLLHYRDRLQGVFHFEPVQEVHGNNLLGLLRRRYAEANDYNRDLVTCLSEHPHVRIRSLRPNVFGLNPLNATTIIEWEPS